MENILLLEDDFSLSEGIKLALQSEDVKIRICHSIKEAETALSDSDFSLLILDINLPDGNGLELLKNIRQSSKVPVIMLTANDMETDIVTGLELGADDYITKPFSLAVLRARVKAQLRRNTPVQSALEIEDFRFDFERMEFFKGSQEISLSKTEQKLLKLLVLNRGRTMSRAELVDKVWTDGAEYVDENALSVTVKRLRDKLDGCKKLKTVYGIGYVWEK